MRPLALLLLPSLSLAQARSSRTIPIRKEPPAAPSLALPPSYTTVPGIVVAAPQTVPQAAPLSTPVAPDTVLLARPWWPTAVALAAIGGTALWRSSRSRTVVDTVVQVDTLERPITATPEPATVLLVGCGLLAVGVVARRGQLN